MDRQENKLLTVKLEGQEIIPGLNKYIKVHGKAKIRADDGSIQSLEIKDIEVISTEEGRGILKEEKGFRFKDLLNSDLVGIWKDRADISDTVKFVEEIRTRISRRGTL